LSTAGLPQPKVQLENSSIVGSQGSVADAFSPKSSFGANEEVSTIPAPASLSGADDSLPKSLQDALNASGANGLSDSQRTIIERQPSVRTPESVASPRPSEASFPAVPQVTARADFLRVRPLPSLFSLFL
jgi:hypothetical protein